VRKNIINSAIENIKSWRGFFGVILSGITIFHIWINLFTLTLPEVVEKILDAYKAIFHFPFFLFEELFSVKVNPILKDLFVLWTIAAGSTVRANNLTRNDKDYKARFSLLKSIFNIEWRRLTTYRNFRISIILNFYHWIWRYVIVFFTWPFILKILFKNTPFLMEYAGKGNSNRHYVYVRRTQIENYKKEGYIKSKDLRHLFIEQVIYAFIAAAILIFIFSLDYGK
jgi:hypothetical protein